MGERATSALEARRTTNVDTTAWNVPNEWNLQQKGQDWWPPSSSASSILSKNMDYVASTTSYLPLPWIPTPQQIASLKVSELKQVCGERGLTKNGTKAVLQQRIQQWVSRQLARQQQSSLHLFQAYGTNTSTDNTETTTTTNSRTKRPGNQKQRESPNSLAEWARTVDLEPLLHRREAIHKEKLQGKKVPNKRKYTSKPPDDVTSILTKIFDKPSSPYSNREVKQMYQAAKHSDQMGDTALSKRILMELKECTPHDARVYKRLARLEEQEGNLSAARAILQEGLRGLHSDNAFLWHGLGQLAATDTEAKACYEKAMTADPSLPHPYHALGTLEHTSGRIANAMKTLQKGVEYCPTNHRIHHALGDLYRDAKMLSMAEKSYRKALQHGPTVSHGFSYTALAYVAYEKGQADSSRQWLRKAVQLRQGRHANAWVALAQLEESVGDIEAARATCVAGLAQYERRLLERYRGSSSSSSDSQRMLLEDFVVAKKALLATVPAYRSGDRFFNVYRNWARLEERYGSIESVDAVYERALTAFPRHWRLSLDWAEYYMNLNMLDRARSLYADSCARASSQHHAEPYRQYATMEMNRGNYTGARQILYAGAVVTNSQQPEAELFYTWAVCEWHLGELGRAETLFDHALRTTDDSRLRAYILYSIAVLEHYRGEHILAQHCIALCLKENSLPKGNSRVWDLWMSVAEELGNEVLADECSEQADICRSREDDSTGFAAGLTDHRGAPEIGQMMRRSPWHERIFGSGERPSKFYYSVRFPKVKESRTR